MEVVSGDNVVKCQRKSVVCEQRCVYSCATRRDCDQDFSITSKTRGMTRGLRENGRNFLFHIAVTGDLNGEACLLPTFHGVAGWLCG
jgi:hypothetical protein